MTESAAAGSDPAAAADEMRCIPRISLHEGVDIQHEYLRKNSPFFLTDAGLETWRAWQEWRCEDGGEHPNFARLRAIFGAATAPITNCSSGQKITLHISEFLDVWSTSPKPPLRYLKDWHIVRDFPEYQAYRVPAPFRDDWLNDWWTKGRSAWAERNNVPHTANDYRFCYMGSAGTFTPLHHDVMLSFSWSASIVGRKLWRFFRPCEKTKLWHVKHKEMLVSDSREGHYNPSDFPNVAAAHYVEVVQAPGEVIFVPSGWLHQVHNLDDCISINHNWFNGSNIGLVWQYVKDKWEATEHVIAHLRDAMEAAEFAEHVSRIMSSDIGLSPKEFVGMLTFWQGQLLARVDNEAVGRCSAQDANVACDRNEDFDFDKARLLEVVTAVNESWTLKCPVLLS